MVRKKFAVISIVFLFIGCSDSESEFKSSSKSGSKVKDPKSTVNSNGFGNANGDNAGDESPQITGEDLGEGFSQDEQSQEISGTSIGGDRLKEITGSGLYLNCEKALKEGTLLQGEDVLSYAGNDMKSGECAWPKPEGGGKIAGFKTWSKGLNIPADRQICSFDLSTKGEFRYDDSLLFSLNGRVLFWGNVIISNLAKTGAFYNYDFDRLYDNNKNGRTDSCADGSITCSIPSTQNRQLLEVKFDKLTGYDLALDILQNGSRFDLTITGDNDPDIDCTHSGIELDVSYTYIGK